MHALSGFTRSEQATGLDPDENCVAAPQVASWGAAASAEVRRWSTDELPDAQKVDYYASALEAAVTPIAVTGVGSGAFRASVQAVHCGPLDVIQVDSTPHSLARGERELGRSDERHFRLISSVEGTLDLMQRRPIRLRPTELALLDTGYPHAADLISSGCMRHIRLPAAWLRQWVADPQVLVGRPMSCGSGWGRALAAYASQLCPSFVASSPLPLAVLADHLGALLALACAEVQERPADAATVPAADLADRIRALVEERCSETDLAPAVLAQALNISVRTLHRTLAARKLSFGELLLASRASLAARMLRSTAMAKLTTSEIGRRAGFVDPSHFVRVMRRLLGKTPVQLRKSPA